MHIGKISFRVLVKSSVKRKRMKTLIAVIGSANADKPAYDLAFETGREIIKSGFTLLCGGLSGV